MGGPQREEWAEGAALQVLVNAAEQVGVGDGLLHWMVSLRCIELFVGLSTGPLGTPRSQGQLLLVTLVFAIVVAAAWSL